MTRILILVLLFYNLFCEVFPFAYLCFIFQFHEYIYGLLFEQGGVNVVMESKCGKGKSSSTSSIAYEAPLGYVIEDIRPNGGIKKFRSAAYSNVNSYNRFF